MALPRAASRDENRSILFTGAVAIATGQPGNRGGSSCVSPVPVFGLPVRADGGGLAYAAD
jgi:hypothetical protein